MVGSMMYGVVWEYVRGMHRKLASPESRALITLASFIKVSVLFPARPHPAPLQVWTSPTFGHDAAWRPTTSLLHYLLLLMVY